MPKILEYHFAEAAGNQVIDSSPSGYNALLETTSLYGRPTRAAGRFGRGLSFNGSSLLNAQHSSIFLVNSFTVMAWVRYSWAGYPDPDETRQEVFEIVGSYWMNIRRDTGKLRIGLRPCDAGGSVLPIHRLDSIATIPPDIWTHVAGTYDATDRRIRIYINGILDATSSSGVGELPCTDLDLHPLIIGGRYSPFATPGGDSAPTGPDAFFNGTIDEFRIYSDALAVTPLQNAMNEGDPHMTTVHGTRFDFQSAGEFVSLRGDGLEVQTRQTPIATTHFPGTNAYTGLDTCVSLNTAVAAKVGSHRVSYQPSLSGVPDPDGMQLRVDGVLTELSAAGIELGDGGRIVKSAVGDGIQITFPNGACLILTPGWWASQNKWFLNVNIYNTMACQGTLGVIEKGSWLPALPDGTSLGGRPEDATERYNELYHTFANAWRVNNENSLFDYAPGTSSANFNSPGWPLDDPPCVIPEETPATPLDLDAAKAACASITDPDRKANCIFDVQITGAVEFASIYQQTQQLEHGATHIVVSDDIDPSTHQDPVPFTATVSLMTATNQIPSGSAQFELDGIDVGNSLTLDTNGQATWSTSALTLGVHEVAVRYIPKEGTQFLPSQSIRIQHTVIASSGRLSIYWLMLLLLVILILIVWWF